MRHLRSISAAWLTLFLLAACAHLSDAERLRAEILASNRAVTVILVAADQALLSGAITKAQARSVSAIAHQVNPLLDAARGAIEAQDVPGASQTMRLVNSLLDGLNAYLPTPPPAPVNR